jgi:hypothetical protein
MKGFKLIEAETELSILIISPGIYLVVRCQSQGVLSSTRHEAHLLVLLAALVEWLNWHMDEIAQVA